MKILFAYVASWSVAVVSHWAVVITLVEWLAHRTPVRGVPRSNPGGCSSFQWWPVGPGPQHMLLSGGLVTIEGDCLLKGGEMCSEPVGRSG